MVVTKKETRKRGCGLPKGYIPLNLNQLIESGKATRFKKGMIPWNKGKENPKITGEKHYRWKGGTGGGTARRMLKRLGADLTKCQICGETKKRIDVHHINFNKKDNSPWNLGVICCYCHNAIHNNGVNTRFKEGHLPCSHEVAI